MTAAKNPGLSELDQLCVDTIRFLAVDGVEKAKAGHPGMPMGMAPAAYVLWDRHLKHNPADPKWLGRDRFVLSAGHGSMLLYSLLYMTGYPEMTMDQLKSFRQWGSLTPGHPEFGHTPGVEVTTGPLGQGLSNAVGMAMAQKYLAARYNKEGFNLFDYKIYVIAGDGCLQEGVTGEACSLAGHLGLNNLILIYDDNHITIDGDTSLSFTEDRAMRYKAYGWNVQIVGGDGNDMEAFEKALKKAQKVKDRPCMIQLRTHIGFGSPNKQDSHEAHGAPLGEDEIKLMKKNFGWDPEKTFVVPDNAFEHMRLAQEKGAKSQKKWEKLFKQYSEKYPELAREITDAQQGKLSFNIDEVLPKFDAGTSVATRQASGKVLDALMPKMPLVLGGSADLTPSNNTRFKGAADFQKTSYDGRYIRYGVREHGMAAIMNGIAVSDIVRPYGATFLVFADYLRGAMRVAALSKYPSIFILTHDTIGLGEDGPTHQPIEHLATFRAIPNMITLRPADANETAQAWKFALTYKGGPVIMALSRQGLPVLDQAKYGSAAGTAKGAYVLIREENPDCILIAAGSEVQIAIKAHAALAQEGIKAQVVSMPSFELFRQQDKAYRESVLPSKVRARVGVEALIKQGWEEWIGDCGEFIGMCGFGASAPCSVCYTKFGLTPEAVVCAAKTSMDKAKNCCK